MSKEKLVRYKSKPLTSEQIDRLNALADLPDETIDFSDMPELGDDFFTHAVRGDFYRPVKRQLTLRLDADLIDWFKSGGRRARARLSNPHQCGTAAIRGGGGAAQQEIRLTRGGGPI